MGNETKINTDRPGRRIFYVAAEDIMRMMLDKNAIQFEKGLLPDDVRFVNCQFNCSRGPMGMFVMVVESYAWDAGDPWLKIPELDYDRNYYEGNVHYRKRRLKENQATNEGAVDSAIKELVNSFKAFDRVYVGSFDEAKERKYFLVKEHMPAPVEVFIPDDTKPKKQEDVWGTEKPLPSGAKKGGGYEFL